MDSPGDRPRARTETFEITVSGLLTKRAESLGEALRLRDQLLIVEGDIAALDRILAMLGYGGELEAVTPRQFYDAPFARGQTMRAILDAMREVGEPMLARQIAERAAPKLAKAGEETPHVDTVLSRVTKALMRLKRDGTVTKAGDGTGIVRWSLRY